jgi:ABC-type branched-subunit amino acid transport system ATPase component
VNISQIFKKTPRPSSKSPEGRGLDVKGVDVSFAGLVALENVDLHVERGELVGLIGPNGAGKSTMVNVITGHYVPDKGTVFLSGQEVTGQSPDWICRQGLGRTFQNARLFPLLSVEENIEAAALLSSRGQNRTSIRKFVHEQLEVHNLAGKAHLSARALPAGDQRRLALARALATRPSFLLLDEPAAGLNEVETEEMRLSIASIRDNLGCGILVIEHNMSFIMRLCDRIQVLNSGRTICVGTPKKVQTNPAVIEAYLGSSTEVDNSGVLESDA